MKFNAIYIEEKIKNYPNTKEIKELIIKELFIVKTITKFLIRKTKT